MRPFNVGEIEDAATELKVHPALVEKEWHAVRVVGLISEVRDPAIAAHFSGGTALSVGHGLTARFSEDVDFKLRPRRNMDATTFHRAVQSFAASVRQSLTDGGYNEDPGIFLENQRYFFIRLGFIYKSEFETSRGLRPYIKIEMIGEPSEARATTANLFCRVTRLAQGEADVPAVACVDPVETAADKVSALTWRVLTRNRQDPHDDPTLVRHLYDLHCMREMLANRSAFGHKVIELVRKDADRGGGVIDRMQPWISVKAALERIEGDPAYLQEYDSFVGDMCFNNPPPALDEVMKNLKSLLSEHARI